MTGGIMQLVTQGAQDIYLVGNPSITYFKTVYKRHTPFGTEYIDLFFDPAATFTPTQQTKATCKIDRNGDLLYDTYVTYQLPAIYTNNKIPFSWAESVGTKIINQVVIRFDGSQIDIQTGDYMKVYYDLTAGGTAQYKYNRMVGNVSELQNSGRNLSDNIEDQDLGILAYKLYIPLSFWFCTNPGSAIPLIALQYNEVYLDVTFNQLNDLIRIGIPPISPQRLFGDYSNSDFNITIRNYLLSIGFDQTNVIYYFTQNNWQSNSNILANYIFLGDDERQMFAQTSHEYLITQTQFNFFQGLKKGPNTLGTTFNHPVSEIIWYLTRDDLNLYNDWYNFTGLINTNAQSMYTYLSNLKYFNDPFYSAASIGNLENSYGPLLTEVNGQIKAANTNVQIQTYFPGYFNIMESFQPILNNNDRSTVFDANFYFNLNQWKYHTGATLQPVYVLSFGLEPEKLQPTGTQNFSRLNNQYFKVNISDIYPIEEKFNCSMYARNYNVVRIIGGIGSIVFSN
jgi:hypothetical protein